MRRTFFVALALGQLLFAAETGKIAGRVLDRRDGTPLPNASVVLLGTELGAACDRNGFYVILGVPVGRYKVEASVIGYQSMTVTDVQVEADRTTDVSYRLRQAAIQLPGITVKSERPTVSKEIVAARYAVQREQIGFLPADRLSEVMLFTTGVARTESSYHVRGGRATEVDYLVDGVSVVDPLSGEFGIELSRGVADEVIFMPGGFSAEYGRAMSGVVNLITVNPKLGLATSYRLKSEKPMPFYYDFGYNDQSLQFHLPLGRRVRTVFNAGATTIDDWDPRLFRLPHKGRADYSLYGKTVFEPSGKLRAALSGALFRTQFDRYHSKWKFKLEDYRSDLRRGSLGVARLSYMPESRSYYNITASRFQTDKTVGVREPGEVSLWRDFEFRDTSRYGLPVIDKDNPWHVRWNRYWYFYTKGTFDQSRKTRTGTWSGSASGSNQATPNHQLTFGANTDRYDVSSDWSAWVKSNSPFLDTYRFLPWMLSAYAQDKVEYEGLYANLGLRFDRFDPAATFVNDSADTVRASPKSQVSPRLGASFRITEWLFARANFGYYFQVPLLSYLYDNTVDPMYYRTAYKESLLVVGNPDLAPERTQSYELGLQGEVLPGFLLTTNIWRKDVYDLVGTIEKPALPQHYVTYVNTDYARLTGVEFIFDLRRDWFSGKFSYTLSFARGTSSYANESYYEFIRRGRTVPAVEYPLDFDQRNRFFVQADLVVPRGATSQRWADFLLDSLGVHVLAYLGNGFPYSPPGGKGDPATWNTLEGPWRSNIDAVVNKGINIGRVRLDLVVEVLNLLDIRDVMYVYPETGLPDDDGQRFEYYDFEFVRGDRSITPVWFGQEGYDPQRDDNHDGFVSPDEAQFVEYWRVKEYHKAAVDWVNNYGPPRRARLGFAVSF